MRAVKGQSQPRRSPAPRSGGRPSQARRAPQRGHDAADEEGRGWLPSIDWNSPMLLVSLAFVSLAGVVGLFQGGHMGLGAAPDKPVETAASAWFPVEEILAAGHYHTRKSDLLAAIGVKPGDDMMDVNPQAIRAQVEALDWVSGARVTRLWPSTLEIEISEKEPYAIWQTRGVLWLVDRAGGRITKQGVEEFAGLPMVVGDGAPEHAAELIEILNRFPVIQRANKASVRVGGRRWDLHLKNGIQVRLPEDGVEDALHRLTLLQQEQKIFERDIETVDLRLADRLVIRPREGAAQSVARGEST